MATLKVDGFKPVEMWRRDSEEITLWHGPNGLIVNEAALNEREAFFELIRLRELPTAAEAPAAGLGLVRA